MNLKENYKNDIYSGMRKYRTVQNEDGTISLQDVTTYTQDGDIFSADDINTTNKAVNSIERDNTAFRQEIQKNVTQVTSTVSTLTGGRVIELSESGWSSTAPYIQTVSYPELTESGQPLYGLLLKAPYSDINVEAQKLAWSYVDRAASGNGKVTFYCYSKRPAASISVIAKGVQIDG